MIFLMLNYISSWSDKVNAKCNQSDRNKLFQNGYFNEEKIANDGRKIVKSKEDYVFFPKIIYGTREIK